MKQLKCSPAAAGEFFQIAGFSLSSGEQNFVQGAAVLGAAGLIAKIVGALYRIPVANVLGSEGSGYYGMVYPVYSALAAVSTLGIPTAVSQLVATRAGLGDTDGAARVFYVANRFLLVLGGCLAAAFFALAGPISDIVREPPAAYAFAAVSPAFFFSCMISCYRGVLQGYEHMTPTAVSQVIEQLGKLGLGLTAAWIVMNRTENPAYGAAAALGGIASSEAISLLYMMGACKRSPVCRTLRSAKKGSREERRTDLLALLAEAFPVTIGACVMPIVLSLDSVLVAPALQASGMGPREAASQVGFLTMNVAPLINLPAAFSAALAMSVVPALAQSVARSDAALREDQTQLAMKMGMWIGLPCAAGFAFFAKPILALLFGSLSPAELDTAAGLLRTMSTCVLFLTLVQTATGVLQGVRRQILPVIALAAGAAAKAILTPLFVRVWGVSGAAWASVACFAAACAVDIYCICRYTPFRADPVNLLRRPFFAAVAMICAAELVNAVVGIQSQNLGIVLAIVVGAAVYLYGMCRSGCVSERELQLLPGGRKLVKLGLKLGFWKEKNV